MADEKDDIIIHPIRGQKEKPIPETGLILLTPGEARIGTELVLGQGGERRFLYHSELIVDTEQGFFLAGPAVGAPMAAMTLEKLIALGAKKVVMYGWCGAATSKLKVGELFVGGSAHCGEGTSSYYGKHNQYEPSERLGQRVGEGIGVSAVHPMWTTDAPYRESRKMLKALGERFGVCGVDMEYSALCSVAAFRGIDFAGLFLVSDELYHEKWHPGFTSPHFKQQNKTVIEQLIQVVREQSSW